MFVQCASVFIFDASTKIALSGAGLQIGECCTYLESIESPCSR
jgi:hypothetical protein